MGQRLHDDGLRARRVGALLSGSVSRREAGTGLLALAAAALPAAAAGEVAVRRSSVGEVQTLDPQLWVYGQDGNVAQDLFQGLTTLDAQGFVAPGAAASWQASPDGRTMTYALRPALQWSDGTPITSADFVWSLRRFLDPATAAPSASLLFMIRNAREVNAGRLPVDRLGVRAPDARTVFIELERPSPALNELLCHRGLPVPRHVVERYGREWTRPGRIVSNGAFVLGEWRLGAYLRLVRNPRFHSAADVRIDAVYHVPIEDPKVALLRYRAGEIDVAVSVPSEQIDTLRRDYPRELRIVPTIGLEYYAFNVARRPFDDPRVRRALSMAVDRQLLAARILRAGERPAYGMVPPGVVDYAAPGTADFAGWTAAQRGAEARRLLAAAGFGTARPLAAKLRYANTDVQNRIALAISAMWQPLGVRTELVTADLKTHQQAVRDGDFDVARASWYAEARDAGTFLDLLDGRSGELNVSRWRSAPYDALIDEAGGTSDAAKRAAALQRAEALAMREQPVAPLYFYTSRRLVSPKIRGWVDNARGVNLSRYLSRVGQTVGQTGR